MSFWPHQKQPFNIAFRFRQTKSKTEFQENKGFLTLPVSTETSHHLKQTNLSKKMTIFAPKKPTKLATIAAAVVWVLLVACTHQTPHPNDDSYKPRLQLETKNTSLVKNAAEARCFTCGFVETATAAIKNTCIDVTGKRRLLFLGAIILFCRRKMCRMLQPICA